MLEDSGKGPEGERTDTVMRRALMVAGALTVLLAVAGVLALLLSHGDGGTRDGTRKGRTGISDGPADLSIPLVPRLSGARATYRKPQSYPIAQRSRYRGSVKGNWSGSTYRMKEGSGQRSGTVPERGRVPSAAPIMAPGTMTFVSSESGAEDPAGGGAGERRDT